MKDVMTLYSSSCNLRLAVRILEIDPQLQSQIMDSKTTL